MTFRISLLLILITGFVLSCSTGPEFGRDNLNDPESGQFSPDVGNLALSIDSSKDVTLIWNDISDFEDGFIIQKSYENKESFFDLDTLPANSSRYIDSTKKLAVDTFYRVRSFSENSDSLGSSKVEQLILDPLKSIRVPDTQNNEIAISWETNSTGYEDAFLIEKRTANSDNWIEVDSVSKNQRTFSFTDLSESYLIDVKVTALLKTNLNEYQPISQITKQSVGYNLPSDLDVNVIDEETVSVRWKDNSSFNDEFIIYQRPASGQYSAGSGNYIPLDTLENHRNVSLRYDKGIFYDINISPYNNGNLGNKIDPVIITLVSTRPDFKSPKSVSESELTLEWVDNNSNNVSENRYPTKRFILEQRNLSTSSIKTYQVESGKTSYRVSNLNKDNIYEFSIRSLASDQDKIEVNFEQSLTVKSEFPLGQDSNYPFRLRLSPAQNNYVYEYARHSGGSYSIRFANKISGSLDKEIVFNTDFRGYSLSKDEKYLAIFGGSEPGIYEYTESNKTLLYDLGSDTKGIFINNDEIILSTDSKSLSILDLTDNSIIQIENFNQFNSNFEIFEIYPFTFEQNIYLLTSSGTLIYDLQNQNVSEILDLSTDITDVNDKGEILLARLDKVLLINTEYQIEEFKIPSDTDAASAEFIDEDYIVVAVRTSNQSKLFVFDKRTKKLISTQVGQSIIAVDRTNAEIFSINQYMRGNGYIFSFEKAWSR